MNIFRRLYNLWVLSGLKIDQEYAREKDPVKLSDIFYTTKASIVDMDDPLSIDLGNDE